MKMSPERRARVEERVQNAIKEMALVELRSAREFTQAAPCFRMGGFKSNNFRMRLSTPHVRRLSSNGDVGERSRDPRFHLDPGPHFRLGQDPRPQFLQSGAGFRRA
jgi:hypothetical protein